ncbi:MAG: alpha/beta hydrolase [Hahellaceae bacterium]|nr:alpha/beta hydrolase [Hahellaceae bacterium]MCP5169954.1 alpha/beta hydrolase [Hahellaceae bacterium]
MKLLGKDNLHRMSHQMLSYLGSLKRHTLVTECGEWRYLEGGCREGAETIVLVHGLAGTKAQWRSLMHILADRYHVVALDMPALHNGLPTHSGECHFPALAEELAAFIEGLGLKRFHLLGHSLAANVCAVYSGQRPDRVLSLALTSVVAIDNERYSGELSRFAQFKQMMLFNTLEEFAALGQLMFYRPPKAPDFLMSYSMNQVIRFRQAHVRLLSEADKSAHHVRDSLTRITCPCITINGAQDVFVSPETQAILEAHLQSLTVVRLEECAHMPYLEKPRELATSYQRFLSQVSPARTAERLVG